eukprot:Seg1897.4 transcript_id=Seg1897.4/GoldUCD/mRNA.D3Y31 product="Disintegrin and metalloproteinase domain-containing protein 7" protein_id=Seg1897.4/GoldUCD/D3Y31
MEHDTPSCPCSGRHGYCIMALYGLNPVAEKFSSCSIQGLEYFLKAGMGSCLLNIPVGGLYYNAKKCGNNRIDPGEECDCGQPQFCTNTCCNPHTCKLKDGKQCSVGRCCSNCLLRLNGTDGGANQTFTCAVLFERFLFENICMTPRFSWYPFHDSAGNNEESESRLALVRALRWYYITTACFDCLG